MELNEKIKNLVLFSEGGIGKNISGTVAVRNLKKKYPDKRIIVFCGFNEIFLHNPNIYKIFNFQNPLYFYDDYVNEETMFIKEEPYLNYDYINKKEHVTQSWCKNIGIDTDNTYPDIFLLDDEFEWAKVYSDKLTDEGKKKLILIQWVGGKVPEDKTKLGFKNSLVPMFRRSLPIETVEKLVEYFNSNGYKVCTVGHENYPQIKGAENIWLPLRYTIALLKYAHTFIGIDSFLQHAAASNQIDKKGIVCWGGTSPICLGYDKHINLTKEVCSNPFCHRPNSYLFDVHSSGTIWNCPVNEKCLRYTTEEIINVFESKLK